MVYGSPMNPVSQPAHSNRLAQEKSPYLLQHARNPVDWFAWNNEAFQKARQENKPIFLSIGYSTCHWCHVMERESFDNEDVAKIMNQYFVAIKVDREERPDVDQIYLTALARRPRAEESERMLAYVQKNKSDLRAASISSAAEFFDACISLDDQEGCRTDILWT